MVRVLGDADVAELLALEELLPVVEDALVRQGRGAVERPDRPHFPVGTDGEGDDPAGTALAMSAYCHGEDTYATKLASVHEDNPGRGYPTVNAQVLLSDAGTGRPLALLDGTRLTNARTGCVGGLAARELAPEGPVRLGLVGAGTQARWQTRAIDAATDLETVRVYSPSDSREACAADLRADLDVDAVAVDSPAAAVRDATVVVTATTATEAVFPGDALAPGTLVVAVGAYTPDTRELDATTVARSARVFADVPAEVVTIGDIAPTGMRADDLVPLSAVFDGEAGREADDEVLVVESVGTAVMDAAASAHLHDAAVDAGVGTDLALSEVWE